MAFWVGTDEPLEGDPGDDSGTNIYTSGTKLRDRHDTVAGSVYADQNGTIYVEQSPDGENWDISTSYNITAEDGKGFSEALLQPFWRLRFVNTSNDDQEAFRLSANTQAGGDS